jgi:hypothetical protein
MIMWSVSAPADRDLTPKGQTPPDERDIPDKRGSPKAGTLRLRGKGVAVATLLRAF